MDDRGEEELPLMSVAGALAIAPVFVVAEAVKRLGVEVYDPRFDLFVSGGEDGKSAALDGIGDFNMWSNRAYEAAHERDHKRMMEAAARGDDEKNPNGHRVWCACEDCEEFALERLRPFTSIEAYPGRTFLNGFDLPQVKGVSSWEDFFNSLRVELESEQGARLRAKAAKTRADDTLLVLVAALAKEARINIGERGAAVRIAEATERAGAPVHQDTIRDIIKRIDDALEKRSRD